MKTLRESLTYSNVVATAALFVVLGGSAYAATQITGADVTDNSLTGADIRSGSIPPGDLSATASEASVTKVKRGRRGKRGLPGKTGLPGKNGLAGAPGTNGGNGPQGGPGATGGNGTDGTPGAPGAAGSARGYARVTPTCTIMLGANFLCTIDKTKNVFTVLRRGTGAYCVEVLGASTNNTPAAVTVDYSSTAGPYSGVSAVLAVSALGCPSPDSFQVLTYRTATTPASEALVNDVGFTIVVP